jgi:hypothetical protein
MSGRVGYSFELTPNNEIVWEYKTPLISGQPASQGDTLVINNNLTFRLKRYPTDYSAFDGKDLSSQGYIELNPDTEYCDQVLPIEEVGMDYQLQIFPNPVKNRLTIEWEGMPYSDIRIFDVLGIQLASFNVSGGRKYVDVATWEAGIYFVQVDGNALQKFVVSK